LVIGFTGSRDGMTESQKESVLKLLKLLKPKELRHGDCIGADTQCNELSTNLNIPITIHPPDIDNLRSFCTGKLEDTKPYLERDRDIVDSCNILIAAPKEYTEKKGSGTWYTARYALSRHKPIAIVQPNGTVRCINSNMSKHIAVLESNFSALPEGWVE
jgi:hypothetical protein